MSHSIEEQLRIAMALLIVIALGLGLLGWLVFLTIKSGT